VNKANPSLSLREKRETRELLFGKNWVTSKKYLCSRMLQDMDRIFSPSRVFLTPVVASCTAQLCATAAITIPSQVVQLATAVLLVSGDLLVLRRAWGKAVLSKR